MKNPRYKWVPQLIAEIIMGSIFTWGLFTNTGYPLTIVAILFILCLVPRIIIVHTKSEYYGSTREIITKSYKEKRLPYILDCIIYIYYLTLATIAGIYWFAVLTCLTFYYDIAARELAEKTK